MTIEPGSAAASAASKRTGERRAQRAGQRGAPRAVRRRSSPREAAGRREAEAQVARLREVARLRASLTEMMVHDLRTPLTSLLAGLEAAECLGELSEEQRECIESAVSGGEALLGMVNDLLDISKMESAHLHLDRAPLCVPSLVEGALRQVAPLARRKGLQLCAGVAPQMPALWADGPKLSRTLVNLLGNAVKFTPSGGSVSAGASFVQRPGRGDTFVLSVSDTGEGIAPEAASTIFEKFGQAPSGRRSGAASTGMGTGLGLTFCKMIAEAHGGRIWVESELGQGSTFTLTIPARAE